VPYKSFFTAIARNWYVHLGGTTTLKQWGFIGNAVYQIGKLIEAGAASVHQKTFYLADYEPVELRCFADSVQNTLGAKPIRTIPTKVIKTAARLGDIGKRLGWKNPPLSSFRYHNIVTSEVQDLEPLQKVVGPVPYTVNEGIAITVQWLRECCC
jgi:hypothetical protein